MRKSARTAAAANDNNTAAPVTVTVTSEELDRRLADAFHAGKVEQSIRQMFMGPPPTAAQQRVNDQKPAMSNILQEVFVELQKAVSKHGPMHSGHEGHSVILEELDELWDEIKADRGRQASARSEAIQVAAMAVRYVLDLDPR